MRVMGWLIALCGWLRVAHAGDDRSLTDAIATFNTHAVFDLPALDAKQQAALQKGEVLRLLLPDDNGNLRVVGLLLLDMPLRQVWIAGQDPHFSSPDGVTEARLSGSGDRAVWYGFLDLPMPFSDRHWVVDVWNNHDLAQATSNRMWEHPWRLDPDGLPLARAPIEAGQISPVTPKLYDKALYTPVNYGAFVFIGVNEGQTLLSYHATSVIGGNIPERLAAEFIRSGLEKLLRRIEKIARDTVPTHYTAEHPIVLGGDGQPVERYGSR